MRDRELSATEIAEKIGISCANASQHLAIMRNKGILKSRREGVSIHYSLANPKIITACDIMKEVLFEHLNEKQALTKVEFSVKHPKLVFLLFDLPFLFNFY